MFGVVSVPDQAADSYEPLGTKPKFWFRDDHGTNWMFKEARPDTGDDWAEKVACELCEQLGLPHAEYELATWRGRRGVATPSFVPARGRLVLGNELLARVSLDYPSKKTYRVREHTLKGVMAILRLPDVQLPVGCTATEEISTPLDMFTGYLLLDALVANQDRHHENWALVLTSHGSIHLAPTYDHASCLGTNERDETRKDRLTTKDRGRTVERYVERARSAFYATPKDGRPMFTLDAFKALAEFRPNAAKHWLERLQGIGTSASQELFEQIPGDRISDVASDFAQRMLKLNRERLLKVEKAL